MGGGGVMGEGGGYVVKGYLTIIRKDVQAVAKRVGWQEKEEVGGEPGRRGVNKKMCWKEKGDI